MFDDLIQRIESAIDAHPELTRAAAKPHGFTCEASIGFTRGACTARCKVRHKLARGRGSRLMTDISADGLSPEQAVEEFIHMLPIWAQTLRS